MNGRLQARLLKPRPLPPPQGEGPAHFGTIVRRTRAPRARTWRFFLPLIPLLLVAWAALFFGARAFFRFLFFGVA